MTGRCRLGVASSCKAARGSVNRQVRDQRPLWSMTWQAGAGAARTSTPLPKSVSVPAAIPQLPSDRKPSGKAPSVPDSRCAGRGCRLASRTSTSQQRTRGEPPRSARGRCPQLLDLGFLENDVLARNRIVLAEADLVGRRAGVLLGDVKEPGASRAELLGFVACGFCHGRSASYG